MREKLEQMSWDGYKPDKKAWVTEVYTKDLEEPSQEGGSSRQRWGRAELCAQRVWGPCRVTTAGA